MLILRLVTQKTRYIEKKVLRSMVVEDGRDL